MVKIKLTLEINAPDEGKIKIFKKLDRIKSDLAESGWKVRALGMKISPETDKP